MNQLATHTAPSTGGAGKEGRRKHGSGSSAAHGILSHSRGSSTLSPGCSSPKARVLAWQWSSVFQEHWTTVVTSVTSRVGQGSWLCTVRGRSPRRLAVSTYLVLLWQVADRLCKWPWNIPVDWIPLFNSPLCRGPRPVCLPAVLLSAVLYAGHESADHHHGFCI